MIKPMLAAQDMRIEELRYPLIASPKLDGVRCTIQQRTPTTRTGKKIPNEFINRVLISMNLPNGLDGELMVGKTFQACTSGIMTVKGTPAFALHVFDCFNTPEYPLTAYTERLKFIDHYFKGRGLDRRIKIVPTKFIKDRKVLDAYEAKCIAQGFEGVILRDPKGVYKHGRSTFKEHGMLKLKRFADSEAKIIGLEEEMHNTNEKVGGKRTTHKAGLIPKGTLGRFVAIDKRWPNTFRVGTGKGLTKALRQEIWNNHDQYVGKIIKYKYQDFGSVDAPRSPVFLGFRDPIDM